MLGRLTVLLLLGARLGTASAAPAWLDGFDAWVDKALATWRVPGLAVAAVQKGQVVLLRGYGQRDLRRGLPVTPATLFAIASITKSFTVVTLAQLVAEGKLDWDRPVVEYLPGFALGDPLASAQLTPRDLVSHRTGLARHDSLRLGHGQLRRSELLPRLRHLPLQQLPRTVFVYNNLMFSVAGHLAEVVAGRRWEDLVRQQILLPLGMKGTRVVPSEMQRSTDFALPYKLVGSQVKEMPFAGKTAVEGGPAGSITSSAEDMARYLLFQLGERPGVVPGIGPAELEEMHRPQVVVPGTPLWPELGADRYALGWYVSSYRGRELVWHTGSIGGFTAMLALLPQERIGVVAMANLDGARLPNAVAYVLLDHLLGLAPLPWSERLLEARRAADNALEEARRRGLSLRRPGTRPGHELAEYSGRYTHPAYGTLRIEHRDGTLRLLMGEHAAPLEHFHHDIFAVPEDPMNRLAGLKLSFLTDPRGTVSAVGVPLEPTAEDIVFARAPDEALLQPAVLDRLCGSYRLGAQLWRVSRRGTELQLLSPSGEVLRLRPRQGHAFDVVGRSWSTIDFLLDEAGRARELVWHQADGSRVLPRLP
ncbi:MAG: serine hydrolase [Myxococcota bacterium]|nr:serine hydrolase [Myxococcota bacterium]